MKLNSVTKEILVILFGGLACISLITAFIVKYDMLLSTINIGIFLVSFTVGMLLREYSNSKSKKSQITK